MTEQYIPIITGGETARIRISDVVLIERRKRKLFIVTGDRQYDYYQKIENVEVLLDNRFFPCLKGCYVNLEHISCMSEQSIYFDNGYVYSLGRGNFIRTRQKYKCFLKSG